MPSKSSSTTFGLQDLLTEAASSVAAIFEPVLSEEELFRRSRSLLMRCAAASLAALDLHLQSNREIIFQGTEFSTGIENVKQIEKLLQSTTKYTTDRLAANDGNAPVTLMEVYESSLQYRVQRTDTSIEFESLANLKKRAGQFYTPLSLARRTMRWTLFNICANPVRLLEWRLNPIRILDPAMGAGIFLICVLEYLEERVAEIYFADGTERPTRKDLVSFVYGVDSDPSALEATQLALWLFTNAPSPGNEANKSKLPATISECARNLRCADAIISQWSSSNRPPAEAETGGDAQKIFYWEEQFAEVFVTNNHVSQTVSGFDAVISNPPWELAKPNAQEFFTFTAPDFRKLGKQEASEHSARLLSEHEHLRHAWSRELQHYKDKAQFLQEARANSSTDSEAQRPLFKSPSQSDLNAYKLFLDLGFSLLKTDGYLTMVVPSGILVDKGALGIRERFLNEGRIRYIESFSNVDGTFKIHRSFTYSVVCVQKGGSTEDFYASFGNTNAKTANSKSNSD
jgi:hypothetical protein